MKSTWRWVLGTGCLLVVFSAVAPRHASSQAPPKKAAPQAVTREITGVVFNDQNRNGRLDPAEKPLAGETVLLTDSAGEKTIKSVSTAADGKFRFDNLEIGDYRVTVKIPDGFERTTDDSRIVAVSAGKSAAIVRFGIATVSSKR